MICTFDSVRVHYFNLLASSNDKEKKQPEFCFESEHRYTLYSKYRRESSDFSQTVEG